MENSNSGEYFFWTTLQTGRTITTLCTAGKNHIPPQLPLNTESRDCFQSLHFRMYIFILADFCLLSRNIIYSVLSKFFLNTLWLFTHQPRQTNQIISFYYFSPLQKHPTLPIPCGLQQHFCLYLHSTEIAKLYPHTEETLNSPTHFIVWYLKNILQVQVSRSTPRTCSINPLLGLSPSSSLLSSSVSHHICQNSKICRASQIAKMTNDREETVKYGSFNLIPYPRTIKNCHYNDTP